MDCPSDVDLLLIGKTGNGKSATGNSILGKRAFRSKSATESVTKNVNYDVTDFHGKIIKVVDGPGVGDTRMNTEKSQKLVKSTMEYAISANPRGYHAFLLVVRFGGRFTEEDRDTIAFLKAIFGEDFVRRFAILVLTCGDSFDPDEEGYPFDEWVKRQRGIFQDLVQECNRRVILFNNKTKDEKERETQIIKLLEEVECLNSKGIRYTDENFARARDAQERVMVESKKPIIEEKTLIETSLILEKLNQAQKVVDPKDRVETLEKLLGKAGKLITSIETKDRGTGALKDLMANVTSIQASINGEIKSCHTEIREIERIEAYKAQAEKRMREEKIKQQKMEEQMRQMQLEENRKREIEKQEREWQKKLREEEEAARKQRENMEKELREKRERENQELQRRLGKMEDDYREIKDKNNESILGKVVSAVTWPLRKVGSWLFG